MLDVETLLTYLRQPRESVDIFAATLIVEITNGLVAEVTGVLDPEPARVQAIRLEMAARAMRNPEGHTSETIDAYTWRAEPSRSGVYLSDEERLELVSLVTGNPNPGPWAGSLAYRR